MDSARSVSDAYMPTSQPASPYTPGQAMLSPSSQRLQGKTQSYSPLLRSEPNAALSYGSPYAPTPPVEESASAPAFGAYQPPQAGFDDSMPANGEQAPAAYTPSMSYEPPSSSFDTPSYTPYEPEPEEDEATNSQPKKKSSMDDDDDDELAARASALKISSGKSDSKSDADRATDEAFRKAAEADAKRDKEAGGNKKGWFGGWFKKDPNMPQQGPGPIKAKLGEENSFVYDPELKKWINKKAGAVDTGRPTATPPPPRGGPPGAARSASGGTPPIGPPTGLRPPTSMPPRSSSMPPPMGIPSRASTPGVPSDNEGAPKPPTLTRPPLMSGPPSRPGTGLSTASSIDDLLGAAQPRKGPGAKKKKGGRYVDVMAQGN